MNFAKIIEANDQVLLFKDPEPLDEKFILWRTVCLDGKLQGMKSTQRLNLYDKGKLMLFDLPDFAGDPQLDTLYSLSDDIISTIRIELNT